MRKWDNAAWTIALPARFFNANDEQMGSTTFGNAITGLVTRSASPQQIETGRGTDGRVGDRA